MIFRKSTPKKLGIKDGKLVSCPRKSNCVCSQAEDNPYFIAPLEYDDTAEDAIATLSEILRTQKNVKIITARENYIHAECKSSLLGFVDDLELLWCKTQNLFHVRSASRLGYSDFGVNRRRVENLRKILSKR